MSSNIKVQRICEYCKEEFTARTTVTRYCSSKCRKGHYRSRKRTEKIKKSNAETLQIKSQPIELLKAKEFLTVREVAQLLNCSVRSVYYYIKSGKIEAVNLGERMTRVKRSAIDKLFSKPKVEIKEPEPIQYDIKDCYTLTEVQNKYGISEAALYNLIKRNKIPKIRKGWYAYVPKQIIQEIFT